MSLAETIAAASPREQLRAWRSFHGVSQIKLAELVGSSQAVISRLELGTVLPDAALAARIRRETGVEWVEVAG
jgi:transcriptional regulator with XRE-family HTH domain